MDWYDYTELSILIPKQAVTLPTLSLLQNRGLPISAGGEGYDRSQNNAKPIALTQIKQGRLKSFQTALFDTHSNKVSCRSGEPQTVCTCGKAGRQRSQVICLNRHHSIDGLHAAQSAGLPTFRIIQALPSKASDTSHKRSAKAGSSAQCATSDISSNGLPLARTIGSAWLQSAK